MNVDTVDEQIRPLCWSDVEEDTAVLRSRLGEDGYLALGAVAPTDLALRARRDILELCLQAGWLDPNTDMMKGRWSGGDIHTEGEPAYMDLYQQVLQLSSFNAFPQQPAFINLASRLLGETAFNHNSRIARIVFPQNTAQSTAPHQDHHYIPGTADVLTIWAPLGDCPVDHGVLALLRGSQRLGMIAHSRDPSKKFGQEGVCAEQWAGETDLHWVAGDMKLGDILVFHSEIVHKALPNLTDDRIRLSLDNRYQGVNNPVNLDNLHLHYNI